MATNRPLMYCGSWRPWRDGTPGNKTYKLDGSVSGYYGTYWGFHAQVSGTLQEVSFNLTAHAGAASIDWRVGVIEGDYGQSPTNNLRLDLNTVVDEETVTHSTMGGWTLGWNTVTMTGAATIDAGKFYVAFVICTAATATSLDASNYITTVANLEQGSMGSEPSGYYTTAAGDNAGQNALNVPVFGVKVGGNYQGNPYDGAYADVGISAIGDKFGVPMTVPTSVCDTYDVVSLFIWESFEQQNTDLLKVGVFDSTTSGTYLGGRQRKDSPMLNQYIQSTSNPYFQEYTFPSAVTLNAGTKYYFGAEVTTTSDNLNMMCIPVLGATADEYEMIHPWIDGPMHTYTPSSWTITSSPAYMPLFKIGISGMSTTGGGTVVAGPTIVNVR